MNACSLPHEDRKLKTHASNQAVEQPDLSPFLLDTVQLQGGNSAIRFFERLSLQPVLHDTGCLAIEYEPLHIDVFAPNREQLWHELLEQICMLWLEYGMATDGELSSPAIRFREIIRATMEEVNE